MKLCNIHDAEKLFSIIDGCVGKVELVTEDGDRLNLKSRLSQYVSFVKLFNSDEIPEIEIVAYDKDDIEKIFKFMLEG